MRSACHRILDVADHKDTAELMKARLGMPDDEVALAHPAADGFHLAHSEHFDLYYRFQEKGFHHEGHKEHEERKKTQTALIVTLRVLRFFVVLFS